MKIFLVLISLSIAFLTFNHSHASDSYQDQTWQNECAEYDDANECLSKSRAVPYVKNGKIQGYKKVENDGNGKYENLELKRGEVVTMPDPNAEDY